MVVMKQTLLNLFKPYKPVKEVTAHHNVRMRGQAFVTFPDVELANKARKEVEQFPLYGKPMVSPIRTCSISPRVVGTFVVVGHPAPGRPQGRPRAGRAVGQVPAVQDVLSVGRHRGAPVPCRAAGLSYGAVGVPSMTLGRTHGDPENL